MIVFMILGLGAANVQYKSLAKPETENLGITGNTMRMDERRRGDLNSALLWTVSGYCPCAKCCGRWAYKRGGGWTKTGTRAVYGRTCAVDPSIVPLGASVWVEGIGWLIAEDTGSMVKGLHIDIFFPTHAEALRFGWQRRRVAFCSVPGFHSPIIEPTRGEEQIMNQSMPSS